MGWRSNSAASIGPLGVAPYDWQNRARSCLRYLHGVSIGPASEPEDRCAPTPRSLASGAPGAPPRKRVACSATASTSWGRRRSRPCSASSSGSSPRESSSAEEVGRAAALVSAMLFVSRIHEPRLGQVFVSRLPLARRGHDWSLTVTTGLALVAVASLAGGAIAAVLPPDPRPGPEGRARHRGLPVLLPVVVGRRLLARPRLRLHRRATRETRLCPQRRRARTLRGRVIGAAALGPLDGGHLDPRRSGSASFLLDRRLRHDRALPALGHDVPPTLDGWRRELAAMRGLIAGHQSINLGAQASTYLLPVIVSARLGPDRERLLLHDVHAVERLFFIAPAISNALFAEGAHAPERLGEDLRRGGPLHPPACRPAGRRPPRRRAADPRSLRSRLLRKKGRPCW